VRLVKMNGVDLQQFQFDYDQTWAAFFMNADGAIYGRYGTRAGGKTNATTHISVASLKKTLERALGLHQGYPANKAQLAGKRGAPPAFRFVEDSPVKNRKEAHCVHCHHVREDLRKLKWQQQKLTADDIWVYPLPENIGLKMEVDDGLRVKSVTPDSPAAQAGILAGDELANMNGQRLISQADIQGVLHNAPAQSQLAVSLTRDGAAMKKTLNLSGDWKQSDLSWRESSWALRPGLWTVPLSKAQKQEKGLAADALGLRVKWVFGKESAAKKAGLRDGDLIAAVDGKTAPLSEAQFLAHVRLNHPPGSKLRLTLLRSGEREEVTLRME
jgi:predicted metalloprotease with PDZ domain